MATQIFSTDLGRVFFLKHLLYKKLFSIFKNDQVRVSQKLNLCIIRV